MGCVKACDFHTMLLHNLTCTECVLCEHDQNVGDLHAALSLNKICIGPEAAAALLLTM